MQESGYEQTETDVKITEIETLLVHNWLFVRVHTDTGIYGIGEGTYFAYQEAAERTIHVFKQYLLGQDPLRMEHHWQFLYRNHCFRGAAVGSALAAIDMALWDIAGKHYGAPVYSLLGGKCRDRVRMYSILPKGTPEELAKSASDAVLKGYTAVKINPIPDTYRHMGHTEMIKETVARVSAVRDTVGTSVDIGVEAHNRLSPAEAVALGAELEKFSLLFYEDPIPPESIQSMTEVAAKVRIPIAAGERLFNIFEFRELLQAGGAHIVRPDLGAAGGITQCKKIAAVAESFNASFMAHNFLSPVTTAACLHLDAAIPNFLIQEHSGDHLPPKSDLLKEPLKLVDGFMELPDGPGLGIDLDEEFIKSHPYKPMWRNTPTGRDGSVAYS